MDPHRHRNQTQLTFRDVSVAQTKEKRARHDDASQRRPSHPDGRPDEKDEGQTSALQESTIFARTSRNTLGIAARAVASTVGLIAMLSPAGAIPGLRTTCITYCANGPNGPYGRPRCTTQCFYGSTRRYLAAARQRTDKNGCPRCSGPTKGEIPPTTSSRDHK